MMHRIAARTRYAEKQNFSLSPKLLKKFIDAPGASLIVPRLYLGDFKDAGDLKLLESLRITHVVSVIENQPWPLLRTRLKRLHINIHDDASEDILQHLDHTTQYIQRALHHPESVVLVHCFKGKSRSTTVVAAYLLATSDSRTAIETIDFIREKRSIIEPNLGFVLQLKKYDEKCREQRGVSRTGLGRQVLMHETSSSSNAIEKATTTTAGPFSAEVAHQSTSWTEGDAGRMESDNDMEM